MLSMLSMLLEPCKQQIALPIIWGNRDQSLVLELLCINNLIGPETLFIQIRAFAFKMLEGNCLSTVITNNNI